MTHYIALDWGERKIGVALADAETKIAFAHMTAQNDDAFLDMLSAMIKEHNVECIIAGMATHAEQSDNSDALHTFKEMIEKSCGVNVLFVDEMFTTKMAQDNRKQGGKKNIADDDAEAARIILQSWLDTF